MKKYLYLLPLLVLILLPKNVFAFVVPPNDYGNVYLYPSSLTSVQKQSLLESLRNDECYQTYSNHYPYHFVVYQDSSSMRPFQYNYKNILLIAYFEELPTLTIAGTQAYIESSKISAIYSYGFNFDTNSFSSTCSSMSLGMFRFFNLNSDYTIDVTENGSISALYTDAYLYSNFNIKIPFNFNLYDISSNLIKTYTTEDDLFNFEKEEEKKEYTIEDILNSDDILYSLSKELIGSLPEEFSFIYSVVSLMLGILVLIVVISPFVLLKRWLM